MTLEKPKIPPQIIVDAHQKIARQALLYGDDYLRHPLALGMRPSVAGLPDALLGRLAVVFAAITTTRAPNTAKQLRFEQYDTPRGAYEQALAQWDYYQRLSDTTSQVWLLREAADLHHVLETWQPDTPLNLRRQGLVVTLSGADPILEPRQFEEWYARGVRCVALAYAPTRYSGDCEARGDGLSKQGYELLEVLADYQAIVDLVRISEKGFFEVLDRYDGPLMASAARLEDKSRKSDALSPTMIRRLAERDGVIALRLHHMARFSNTPPSLHTVAQQIDAVCQWTGSSAHVALGSDLNGLYSLHDAPHGLDTTGGLWKLRQALYERGFSAADVEAIMAGNLLRLVQRALP